MRWLMLAAVVTLGACGRAHVVEPAPERLDVPYVYWSGSRWVHTEITVREAEQLLRDPMRAPQCGYDIGL